MIVNKVTSLYTVLNTISTVVLLASVPGTENCSYKNYVQKVIFLGLSRLENHKVDVCFTFTLANLSNSTTCGPVVNCHSGQISHTASSLSWKTRLR